MTDEVEINSLRNIKADEIWFEDGIIIEDGIINAMTTMDSGQVEDIFRLKELNYDIDYYDVYLDYNPKEDSFKMTIVAVGDNKRKYYSYFPNKFFPKFEMKYFFLNYYY